MTRHTRGVAGGVVKLYCFGGWRRGGGYLADPANVARILRPIRKRTQGRTAERKRLQGISVKTRVLVGNQTMRNARMIIAI
jgi:hypothetical protein